MNLALPVYELTPSYHSFHALKLIWILNTHCTHVYQSFGE